jgi:ferrochelatase
LRVAVVLFNLGGPDCPEAVEPFLFNLFSDPAVIGLPRFLRRPVARYAARRRAPVAREIYAKLGGGSPILAETKNQAQALDTVLAARGLEARSFVAMQCWHPLIAQTARNVRAFEAERIVLLPLYPQFSTTTSGASLREWEQAQTRWPGVPETTVCCYPLQSGFIEALAENIHEQLTRRKPDVDYRLLLSAHGLPERTIIKGDPYRWQVEQTARALVEKLGIADWRLTFQSRVGPLKWIGPATDAEIRRAGNEGKGVVIAPIAFVSEHSETLVELDIEYANVARDSGVMHYLRAATVGTHPAFINGLADLVVAALDVAADKGSIAAGPKCPDNLACCFERA